MKSESTERSIWALSVIFFYLWFISLIANLVGLVYYLSIPLFFFFLGRSFRVGLLNWIGLARFSGNYLEEALIDVMISSIMTIGIGGVLASQFMLTSLNVLFVNGVLFGVFSFFWLVRILKNDASIDNGNDVPKLGLDHKLGILGVLLFSVTYVIIRWTMFPYPATSGTDTFSHLAVISQIVYDNGSAHITSGGLYLYHTIVAEFCIISGASPLWVISNIYTFVYPLSMILMFQFLFYITKNSKLSVFATIGTFSVFEHGGLLANYHPFTITFAFVLLYLCYVACYILDPSWFNTGLILTLVGIAILSYFYSAFVSIPLLAYLLVRQGFIPKQFSVVYKILFGGIIVGGGVLILAFYFIAPSILGETPEIQLAAFFTFKDNLNSASSHFTLAYSGWSTIGMIGGLVICWLAVLGKRKMNHPWLEDFNYEIVALLGTSYLIVFFAPISYAFRTEFFIRSINLLLIVTSIFILSVFILTSFSFLIRRTRAVSRLNLVQHTVILCFVMLLIFVPVSYEKTNRQIKYLQSGETRSPTIDEMDAFNWIANNTSPGDYILTDMATGFILRGVIYRNASTSFTVNGRSISAYGHPNLTRHVFDFLNCSLHWVIDNYTQLLANEILQNYTSSETLENYLSSIAYIMISPRTNNWISRYREGIISRVAGYGFQLEGRDPAWTKFDSSYFEVSYRVGDIRVLRLKPQYLPNVMS